VRVDTDCGVDGGMGAGDLHRLAAFPGSCSHCNYIIDPLLRRPADNISPITVELSHFEVGVGIDKHIFL